MSFSTSPNYQYFHKSVADAYNLTIDWLDKETEVDGYRKRKYDQVVELLKEETFLSAACQFHTFFPGHFFKATHTLKDVIGLEKLTEWLKYNPRICIVDIGCGAGAGSAAVVETVMNLQHTGDISHSIEVFCLGIDPNPYSVVLYRQFLEHLKAKIDLNKLNLTCKFEPEGIPQVTSWLIDHLNDQRKEWKLPRLAQVLVMQLNVVSPLSDNQEIRRKKQAVLKKFGEKADRYSEFGREEALAYKSIFETVAIDNLHIFTIGTDNHLLDERVMEMGQAITKIFNESRHKTIVVGEGSQKTTYINPQNSFFAYNRKPFTPKKPFHVNVISITNEELRGDEDWQKVIDEDNLKLAWARTRQDLLRESFTDEIEIRLFDSNLEQNLSQMRQQLMAYAEDLRRDDDYIAYKVPKNASKTRPRGLSRMEEELLSVAIIQKLGKKESQLRGNSFAYRINQKSWGQDTEYLYKYFLEAYKDYVSEVRESAKRNGNGAVIRTDVKSFYTEIVQKQVVEATQSLTTSDRVKWLIKLLLSKNLNEHELGRGLVQGSIGSGFYANVYLTEIDTLFGVQNEWGVKFYRYVDDMVLIIPEPKDGREIKIVVEEVKQTLENALGKLNLELNKSKGKTEIYYDTLEFAQKMENDPLIVQISESYDQIINVLWILDEDRRADLRDIFGDDSLWWYYIEQYQECLKVLGIYVNAPMISRRIFKYLYSKWRRRTDLKGKNELSFPDIPNKQTIEAVKNWSQLFATNNRDWIVEKIDLHSNIVEMCCEAWEEYHSSNSLDSHQERLLQTRIRFAIGKLVFLGFGQAVQVIVEILMQKPWVIREPMWVIEALAKQGFSVEVLKLFRHYEAISHPMEEYLRAVILRAIRFLPEVRSEIWDSLTYYALHGLIAEKLMATETWLFLNQDQGFCEQEKHISDVKQILSKYQTLPSRLIKNYVLLVGLYDQQYLWSIELSTDDPMLDFAIKVSLEGNILNLFGSHEPKLIRSNYYSGQRKDDEGYDPPVSY